MGNDDDHRQAPSRLGPLAACESVLDTLRRYEDRDAAIVRLEAEIEEAHATLLARLVRKLEHSRSLGAPASAGRAEPVAGGGVNWIPVARGVQKLGQLWSAVC